MTRVTSFAPVAGPGARLMILGSMPGVRSLQAAEYYAHPRNAFWPIMAQLLGFPASSSYAQRLAALRSSGIALWDVLGSCYREGSLDSAIRERDLQANDFDRLLRSYPTIAAVFFNGATAERIWLRRVSPGLDPALIPPQRLRLPSTSPAYASMGFDEKLSRWSAALQPLLR